MKEGNYLFSKDGKTWNNSLKQRKGSLSYVLQYFLAVRAVASRDVNN